jgi:BMFP domain-containing protein YqiC
VETSFIQNLARKLADSVPAGAKGLKEDLEHNFQALLATAFERLDLVTREEFDIQKHVLERTREKLTALESELTRLEAEQRRSAGGAADS